MITTHNHHNKKMEKDPRVGLSIDSSSESCASSDLSDSLYSSWDEEEEQGGEPYPPLGFTCPLPERSGSGCSGGDGAMNIDNEESSHYNHPIITAMTTNMTTVTTNHVMNTNHSDVGEVGDGGGAGSQTMILIRDIPRTPSFRSRLPRGRVQQQLQQQQPPPRRQRRLTFDSWDDDLRITQHPRAPSLRFCLTLCTLTLVLLSMTNTTPPSTNILPSGGMAYHADLGNDVHGGGGDQLPFYGRLEGEHQYQSSSTSTGKNTDGSSGPPSYKRASFLRTLRYHEMDGSSSTTSSGVVPQTTPLIKDHGEEPNESKVGGGLTSETTTSSSTTMTSTTPRGTGGHLAMARPAPIRPVFGISPGMDRERGGGQGQGDFESVRSPPVLHVDETMMVEPSSSNWHSWLAAIALIAMLLETGYKEYRQCRITENEQSRRL